MDWLPITFAGLPLIVWQLGRMRMGKPVDDLRLPAFSGAQPRTALAAALLLVGLLAGQVQLLHAQALTENGGATAFLKALPLPVYIGRTYAPSVHVWYSALALVLAISEALCLTIVWGSVNANGLSGFGKAVVALSSAGLAFVAITAPVLSSTDPYTYIRASELGFFSYSHDPALGSQNSPYGPLWVGGSYLLLSAASAAVAKIELLRVVNAGLILVMARLLWAGGMPVPVVLCLLLNPAVWFESVVNPHNDMWAMVYLAGAFAATRKTKVPIALTAVLIAFAASVKLPFVIVGAAVASLSRPLQRRLLIMFCAAILAFAISLSIGGRELLENYGIYASTRAMLLSPLVYAQRAAVVLIVLAFAAIGLLSGRAFRGLAWLMPQVTLVPYPWYASWGLPFVFDSPAWAFVFLACLPLQQLFMDFNYDIHQGAWIIVLAVTLLVAINLVRKSPSHPRGGPV